MRRDEADGNTIVSQPHCEIAKTISDEVCERPGEMRYREMLLCTPHSALLGLEARAEALLGSVFRMDEWMEENGSSAADDEFVGRIRHEREDRSRAPAHPRPAPKRAQSALSRKVAVDSDRSTWAPEAKS
jgi:hypothetical protein